MTDIAQQPPRGFRLDAVIQVRDLILVGSMLLALIIWGLRLEAKVNETAKDVAQVKDITDLKIETQKTRTDQLAVDIRSSLEEIKATLRHLQDRGASLQEKRVPG